MVKNLLKLWGRCSVPTLAVAVVGWISAFAVPFVPLAHWKLKVVLIAAARVLP